MVSKFEKVVRDEDEDLFGSLLSIIGAEALFELVQYRGGIRIEIPKHVRENSALARVIGLPALKRLVWIYGRQRINIPLAKTWRMVVL